MMSIDAEWDRLSRRARNQYGAISNRLKPRAASNTCLKVVCSIAWARLFLVLHFAFCIIGPWRGGLSGRTVLGIPGVPIRDLAGTGKLPMTAKELRPPTMRPTMRTLLLGGIRVRVGWKGRAPRACA